VLPHKFEVFFPFIPGLSPFQILFLPPCYLYNPILCPDRLSHCLVPLAFVPSDSSNRRINIGLCLLYVLQSCYHKSFAGYPCALSLSQEETLLLSRKEPLTPISPPSLSLSPWLTSGYYNSALANSSTSPVYALKSSTLNPNTPLQLLASFSLVMALTSTAEV